MLLIWGTKFSFVTCFSDVKKTKDKIMGRLKANEHFYNGEKGFKKLEVAESTSNQ